MAMTGARLSLWAVAIALALCGYFGWRAWGGSSDATTALITATAQRGTVEDAVTATGTLQPRDYVDVGTQVSGQLKKLHVEIGSNVKAGQLLAEIDPTVYLSRVDADRAQLQNLRAQLADREAQLVLAEQQFQRQSNLMREQAGTAGERPDRELDARDRPRADREQRPRRAARQHHARQGGAQRGRRQHPIEG